MDPGWAEYGDNTSPSMPLGRYMRMFGVEVTLGSIVTVLPADVLKPNIVSRLGLQSITFLKRVVAVPGDEVSATGSAVYVNGREVAQRFTRKQWRAHRANAVALWGTQGLPYWSGQRRMLAEDELFLLADGSEGFDARESVDGRYLGPVRRDVVQPHPWVFIAEANG